MDLAARILTHERVRLEPFEERHRAGLVAAAEADVSVFRLLPFPVAEQGFSPFFDWILEERAAGRWMPHAVFADDVIVGQSCYLNPRPKDCGIEVGGTWYMKSAQGTLVNPTAKLLLLGHAFDSGAERVELKTDAINAQSRRAMEKMGAKFEGLHRHAIQRRDGSWRDNAWYSVLREEWPGVKAGLEGRIAAFD